ncbi:hypothetical protein CspeluHIS016_0900160 [Cutaneotrichosporon spelunceum]|uniref:C2 domain-containing protein n=1 Tax=Cutaneotrichosporon spelunceum TaxID=1672016 RepID=A0AAD3YF74_9TREE|nr:hypothetical protein CspeluHIS016_0900160 [Cutaneotrichosporon spelunceum]
MEPRFLGTLVVVVGTARNLPNKSRFGKQDPFCTVQIGNMKRKTQPIKRGGQHPEWDEELRFPIHEDVDDMLAASTSKPLPGEPGQPGVVTPQSMASKSRKPAAKKASARVMKVAVWADDIKEPELIGEVTVGFDNVLVKGEVDDWWTLQSQDGKDKYCGELYMEFTFYSMAAPSKKNRRKQEQSPIRPPGRPGLPTSTSISGMNLYIPPYQAQQTQVNQTPPPGPPKPQTFTNNAHQQTPPQAQPPAPHRPAVTTYASNSFAELGLPPQPPQLYGAPVAANSLISQMGSMSLGPLHHQRPGAPTPHAATIGHGRTQSYSGPQPPPPPPPPTQQQQSQAGGGLAAPWASLLPQNQGQQQQAAPLPRPLTSNDADLHHRHDDRTSPVPRPHSSTYQQQAPLPPPGHGRTGSLSQNLEPPVAYGNSFQPLPSPPRTTSPGQFAAYQNPHPPRQQGSFSQSVSTAPQVPQPGGYHQPQQQQPYIPAQAAAQPASYSSPQPPRQGTWPQHVTPQGYQQGAHPQQFAAQPAIPPGPNTPQAPSAYQDGGYGASPSQHHQPMPPHRNSLPDTLQAPSTTTGPYVPWHMQTPAVQGGPGGVVAPPAPPTRPVAGYYPSDEFYAPTQQHQQPPVPQHQQTLPQQPLPPAHQPPPPSLPPMPQPPPPGQNYGGYTSGLPQQQPMSAFSAPPQLPQSNFRPNAPPRVPSPMGYPVPPPRVPSPLPPTGAPTNSPPQTNSEWRSYLRGLGDPNVPPPATATQPGEWYPPSTGPSNTMQHAQAQTGYTAQQW